MISNDEFHRSITEQINNIFKKMDSLHKETMDDIELVKTDLNNLKSSYNTHIEVGEALKEQKSKTKLTKTQKVTMSLAVIPIIMTIITIALI